MRLIGYARVDPHTRGEATSGERIKRRRQGRSPHAWGSPDEAARDALTEGSIPTRVGKPRIHSPARQSSGVDPHTRGEALYGRYRDVKKRGRSPHAWGSPFESHLLAACGGSIPTRVGKPWALTPCSGLSWVDPHTRGEAPSSATVAAAARGRSPHAWGSRRESPRTHTLVGSIPTRVGKPDQPTEGNPRSTVDPHTRGEARSTN